MVALAAAVVVGVGAMAAVAVALVLVLMLALGLALANSFDFAFEERERLQPIPIDVAACPHVAVMHEAANQFQIARWTAVLAVNADLEPVPWPEAQMHLDQAAAGLEASITASVDQFPPQVQQQLKIARDSLSDGRAQVALASDSSDLLTRTSNLVDEGQLAFGYADDLIGSQCPVPLRADTESMLPPFTTSTAPKSTPPIH